METPTSTGLAEVYESAGRLPEFTAFGADLEVPGTLERVVAQRAFRRELILVCGDASPTASSANGLNTVMQLYALRLHHVLYISDSAAACAKLRSALPSLACVWSSRINSTKPEHGGLCVEKVCADLPPLLLHHHMHPRRLPHSRAAYGRHHSTGASPFTFMTCASTTLRAWPSSCASTCCRLTRT